MKTIIYLMLFLALNSGFSMAFEPVHGKKVDCFNFEKGKFDRCLLDMESGQLTLLRSFPGEKSIVSGSSIKRLVQYGPKANGPTTLPVTLDVLTVSVPLTGNPQDAMLGIVYEAENAGTKVLLLQMTETEITPLKLWLESMSGKRFEKE